jgi:hypothetical protein
MGYERQEFIVRTCVQNGTVLAHCAKVVDLPALDTYFGIDECYQDAVAFMVCLGK